MDNAIKHSPVGGEIRIRVADLRESAQIEVSDTGPGIPPELQARIFDRFYRGSREPGATGAGLGLAIAKQAVEANGGHLMVVSAGTSGSAVPDYAALCPAAGVRLISAIEQPCRVRIRGSHWTDFERVTEPVSGDPLHSNVIRQVPAIARSLLAW